LEAIRHNKVIITLNNGDTGDWIVHSVSGFIYDVNDDRDLDSKDYEIIAKDVIGVLNDPQLHNDITTGVKTVEASKLWTWDERFQSEIDRVELLLS